MPIFLFPSFRDIRTQRDMFPEVAIVFVHNPSGVQGSTSREIVDLAAWSTAKPPNHIAISFVISMNQSPSLPRDS